MKLYTLATHNNGYYNALIKSSKKNGFKLINLAKGKTWKGLVWKFEEMLKAIKNLNDKEIVAFCDGFDVIVVRKAVELRKIFKLLNCDIIFGNENCNTNSLVNFFNYFSFKYHYLLNNKEKPNTGVYVGYVGKIKKFLSICLKEVNNLKDDQDIAYKIFYYQSKYNLKLKITNEYIYTIPFPKSIFGLLDYKNVKKINCDLNKVFFVHGNGDRNIDVYAKKLSLPTKVFNSSSHSHIPHYLKKVFDNNKKIILLVAILFFFLLKKN